MEGVSFYGQVRNVNTTDVHDAIRLGCRCMQSVFNADDNDVPFFKSVVRPEARLGFSKAHSEAHVPGRHLNALLNAEDAVGAQVDPAAIEKHRKAALFAFSGPIPLPLNRDVVGGPLVHFIPHNIREGLHALYALVHFRGDDEAQQTAERCIAAINEYWHPDKGWSIANDDVKVQESGFITGLARALGPLVKYYRATKSPAALDLAHRLRDKLLAEAFLDEGHYDRAVHGPHTHSTTCVMSSLAQLAELEGDHDLMVRVRHFYDRGLKDIRDELGWVMESSADGAPADRGEGNNTGDIVETALILAKYHWPNYFTDVERMLRCHLLPSQLRDTGFIVDPANPDNVDGLRNVADRHLGAWGFPAPYGHEPTGLKQVSFNMDIVGGVVGSLCEVVRSMSSYDGYWHHLNLFFGHETDAIRVRRVVGSLNMEVTIKKPGKLVVFRPKKQTVSPRVGVSANLIIGNTVQNLVLHHRDRDIRVRLRGDSVEAMENFGADLTFFEPLEK